MSTALNLLYLAEKAGYSKSFQLLFEILNPYYLLRLREDIEVKKVLSTKDHDGIWVEKEEVWSSGPGDLTNMKAAYTPSGDYIGDPKTAKMLVKKGITQFAKTKPDHCVVSIGFNPEENKWYGWSHRAMYGFGIGSTCKKGDCHYLPSDFKELKQGVGGIEGDDKCYHLTPDDMCTANVRVKVVPVDPNNPESELKTAKGSEEGLCKCSSENCVYPLGKGEWTAETMDDAKQMAIDFANGVS